MIVLIGTLVLTQLGPGTDETVSFLRVHRQLIRLFARGIEEPLLPFDDITCEP